MAATTTPQELLTRWRAGDVTSGQALAGACTEWYRALAFARLGPVRGRDAFARACGRFQQGVGAVPAESFLPWAQGLLAEEVARSGTRVRELDPEDAGSQERQLLAARAAATLPVGQARLLAAFYGDAPWTVVEAAAAPLGGLPHAVARARDAWKAALRASGGAFATAGVEPDHAPVAYYEAGRMLPEEESAFEAWVLEDANACRDLVDVAPWALVARSGALAALLVEASTLPASASTVQPPPPAPGGRDLQLERPSGDGVPVWAYVLAAVALLALVVWGLLG